MNQQNQKKSNTTTYIILFVLLALSGFAYFYFIGLQPSPDAGIEQIDNTNQVAGIKVFNLLNEISAININDELFKDNSYQELRDLTVSIPILPIGRPNPFAPVPGMVLNPSQSTSGR